MTLSLYSTLKAWKRENERERTQHGDTSFRPYTARQQQTPTFYAAIAALGWGLGGLAWTDPMN